MKNGPINSDFFFVKNLPNFCRLAICKKMNFKTSIGKLYKIHRRKPEFIFKT